MNRQLQYNVVSAWNSRGVCRVLWEHTGVTDLSRLHRDVGRDGVVSGPYKAIRR